MNRERLQKLIAAAGLCSRRRAEDWLRAGRVSVDGNQAKLGDQADPDRNVICVDGRELPRRGNGRVLLVNKPVGVISTCHDPQGRPTVLDLLPRQERQGLHPVGRLDADSRGALFLTDQGSLTLRLTHPRYNHVKSYRVWVLGHPSEPTLRRWRNGVPLDGSLTRPASVEPLKQDPQHTLLSIELMEGRNRQIRRVAAELGHRVIDLQRVGLAGINLGNLSEGCWRKLDRQEWRSLLDRESYG